MKLFSVKDKAFLIQSPKQDVDFQEGWVNGEYEYKRSESEGTK